MKEGMSDSVRVAVIILVVCFVMSIGLVIVYSGKSFANDYMSGVGNVQSSAATSSIEAIASYDGDLPAASVFVALSKDPGLIESINGTAYSVTVVKISDLEKLFKHQVHVTVLKYLDRYRITISE